MYIITVIFRPHNYADCGYIRRELDYLVASSTLNKLNVEKVFQNVVVDASHISYKIRNV